MRRSDRFEQMVEKAKCTGRYCTGQTKTHFEHLTIPVAITLLRRQHAQIRAMVKREHSNQKWANDAAYAGACWTILMKLDDMKRGKR